jgi:1-acyl-sn-glycerol-3-phosphate acyltransferase
MRFVRSFFAVLATFGITAVLGTLLALFFWLPRGHKPFNAFVLLWSRVILGSIGVKVTVSGREHLPLGAPAIYMVNHQSLLDTPILFRHVSPTLRFVAKKSLRWVPFMGWAMALNDFVFIDRQHRTSAIASLDRAAEKIAAGTSVLVFPEGTRSPGDRLLPFKKGGFMMAIKAQVPIVPLRITGTAALLPRSRFFPFAGPARIAAGAPIPTTGMGPEQRDELMERVRQAIEALPA